MVAGDYEESVERQPEVLKQFLQEVAGLGVLVGLPPVGHIPREAHEVKCPILEQFVEVALPSITQHTLPAPGRRPGAGCMQVGNVEDAQG